MYKRQLLWAANALVPGTVFSFMLVLFPRIIAVGISMRTLIGRNEASRTLAALRNLRPVSYTHLDVYKRQG